jgi:ribA/ribD-fused uncharacterized protein
MEISNLATLRLAVGRGASPEFLFFWGHTVTDQPVGKHVLSQWWPASFCIDGQKYASAEHYMMAQKARLFGDEGMFCAVLSAASPAQAKSIGRRVRGFDEERWVAHRFDIAVRGNVAKFGQNHQLQDWLLATGEMVLVEASPVDKIWGIGLSADDQRARDPDAWLGLNLLGFALMKVRQVLRSPR